MERPIYVLNEGPLALDVSGVGEDTTLHALRLLWEGHAAASLVITREALPLGMEVADYNRAELVRLHTTLPGFALIDRKLLAHPSPMPGSTDQAPMGAIANFQPCPADPVPMSA